MEIRYTKDTYRVLIQLINYIEEKNTEGAGLRWLGRYESWLLEKLTDAAHIKTCNNATLKRVGLRCLYYNNWVIAFSIHNEYVLIEALLHQSRIAD
jgi:hypothetical protein